MKKKPATLLAVSVCLVGYFVLTAWADEREINELRVKAEAVLREAKGHATLGNNDEARELQRHAITLRQQALNAEAEELAEHRERLEHEERARHEQPERHGGSREQIEHIRQAAAHLHAADMHEPAEDLIREAERRQHELGREDAGRHDEGLHRHVEEIARHVHELRERLERMERAILELSDHQE